MDFTTFLAVCSVVVGAGTFGLAALRIKRNGSIFPGNQLGQVEVISVSKVYTIVKEKLQEFHNGICRSERRAVKEVVRTEMKGIREVLEVEIRQMNDTLTTGLENIKSEIENGNSGTGPKSGEEV